MGNIFQTNESGPRTLDLKDGPLRISPETGFIGISSKQTILVRVGGEGWGGPRETNPFSNFGLFTSYPNFLRQKLKTRHFSK